MKKRVLSMLMALALCLSLLPTAALAAEPDVSETPDAAVAAVQARIDALPDAETLPNMDGDAAMAAYDAVQAAYDAYEALTEAQQAKIAGADRFEALFGWFDDQVAPLADGTEENIYYTYDSVDENGNITQGTASLTGPLLTENDKTLSGQYYIVQGNMIIDGNLTVDGSQMGGLVLCAGATLTVNGALIHNDGSSFGIYGTSNNGADAGELVINNSLDNGAAIRTGSTSTPQLNIYSGEVTINAGKSGKLVEGVELYSTNKIHAATLDAKKVLPAEWRGVSSIKGTSLVLEYCGHAEDDPEYVDYVEVGETQHRWQCKACGFEGGVEACFTNTTISGITPNDNGTHTWKCICGREKNGNCSYESLSTPEATPDGKGHTARMCSVCGSPEGKAEAHTYDADGKCTACTFEPLAKDEAGDLYGRTQDHSDVSLDVNDAIAEGHTITLWRPDTIASKTIQGIYIDFDAAGKSATLDMNGYSLEPSKSAPITVENGTLTVTGDTTLVQNGTQELAASAVRVTGGTLIFDGKLTATGANGKPAVEVTGGTLRLKAGDVLNGGVSVAGSTTYANVNALLGDGLAFAKVGEISAIVKGDVKSISENVTVVAHTHDFKPGSDGKYVCACGYVCPHDKFENGVCKICGNGCAHTKVDENGLCQNCKTQMAVKSETGVTVTYGTDFKAAMKAATDGTKITLLADVSIAGRTGISGDNTTVTLDLNEHKITSGWLDVGGKDTNETYTACTLKIIGKGSYEAPMFGGIITVNMKATLDLSKWEGGTISSINISDNSNYEAATREAAVIVGPQAGTIGKLSFGNNQLDELKKTKLSGGSFNEIEVADFGPVKLGELLADGYAFQNGDGSYVEYGTTLKGASISNVKVVKCLHPNMKPDETGVATCEYCGTSGKFVASVDGNLYTDMNEAISYWLENGSTLKLYTDYTATDGTWSIGSGSHTINLNGHRMLVQNDGAFKPTNNMHLTVTDGTELGQIENILLDGNQGGSFTLESGYVCNLKMTGGAVVTLEGGRVDNLDVKNCSENTNLSIQGGSLGKLNITDWADGMHVSATSGSLGAYNLPSGKILADVLDHQYYAEGTSLDRQEDTAQPTEKFVIKQAPYDFGSTSKAAAVPINGSIPFRVDSPSENVGVYDVKWYRRTNSGAEHMTENRVAGVKVGDRLDVFCVITGVDKPNGAMQWQVAVKGYTINVVPANLNGDRTVIRQKPNTGNTGNSADNRLVVTPFSSSAFSDVEYKFEVTYNGQPLELNKDYTIKDSSNWARNAGTHTLTIEGMGNYTGQKSVTWTLEPYELSVENYRHAQINKTYDGTDAVTDSTNGIDALGGFIPDSKNLRNPIFGDNLNLNESDYQLSNMKFDSAEAGYNRTFTGTMTLKPDGNFVFAGGSRVMQIEYGSVSGRQFVFIDRATIAAPAAKALQVANNHAATYTVDLSALLPKLESPRTYGEIEYSQPTVQLASGYYTDGHAKVENGKLILTIDKNPVTTTGPIGTVTVQVTTTNYKPVTLTVNLRSVNKRKLGMFVFVATDPVVYGMTLGDIKLSAEATDGDQVIPGTIAWEDPLTTVPAAGWATYRWTFTPDDTMYYLTASNTINFLVDKATPTGAPAYAAITTGGKTLADAPLTPNASWPSGTVQWVDKDGKSLPAATQVQANTEYTWSFTPADAANYNGATGSVTLYAVSSGGGGGSSSASKTTTTTNADGSVTKTETKKDGTVVETTTGKDGSTTKTETKKDGSSVTESKDADGSTGTVKTDRNGQTTAEMKVSAKAVEDAKKNGEAVKAPVEVKASRNSNTAPTVKVELPKGTGETKVEIPVSNATPGTVAVLVHADGTEEIVKNSLPTEDGIQLTVNGGATVKIVDNSKDFADTRNHWAKDAIDFVSARGLVNGMSATIYAPNASTTRAQLWTILARQNNADLTGGATWFENAQNWAKEKGISDGTNPNGTINRAQMVTMLWRAMGQPVAGSTVNFADVSADAYYASAVAWAVENGITTGVGNGKFDPNATCTRAQIVTFLYRSYQSK